MSNKHQQIKETQQHLMALVEVPSWFVLTALKLTTQTQLFFYFISLLEKLWLGVISPKFGELAKHNNNSNNDNNNNNN